MTLVQMVGEAETPQLFIPEVHPQLLVVEVVLRTPQEATQRLKTEALAVAAVVAVANTAQALVYPDKVLLEVPHKTMRIFAAAAAAGIQVLVKTQQVIVEEMVVKDITCQQPYKLFYLE
jgi:hypothetical protein